jgi:ketosteroid isomerase-like protein
MRRSVSCLTSLIALIAPLVTGAQQPRPPRTAAERTVWALVERGVDSAKTTDDMIFVSGAYPRPIIGQRIARSDSGSRAAHAVAAKRSRTSSKVRPIRVEVSQSGDMAYGFALFDMAFDRPDSTGKTEHIAFEGSQLTVWRRTGGEWRLAAAFMRPNNP